MRYSPSQNDAILANIPANRLGNALDIASAAAFLASNEAGYITGQTLHINGGMAMI
jgi:3-oxoacyl-[acyl-carrier protein] reductase